MLIRVQNSPYCWRMRKSSACCLLLVLLLHCLQLQAMETIMSSERGKLSMLPRKIRRFTHGKIICMQGKEFINEVPQRCWRDRVTLDTSIPLDDLAAEETFIKLLETARRIMTYPRARTDWCLQRGSVPCLGGELALVAESILQQQQYGPEFNDKVQLFLPGALGWEVPKSGIISEFDLYQQAAWGMMQIQKLHQFEYLESVQLFDKGEIDEYDLERLFYADEDEETEMIRVLLKVKNCYKEDRVVFVEIGTILEPTLTTAQKAIETSCLVVAREIRFLIPAGMTRSRIACCFCLRPGLQVPKGEVKLTPFLFDLADPTPFTCDNPFKNHLFFWRYLGETKQRRDASHKALTLASETTYNIFKNKLREVVNVLVKSNQSEQLPPVLEHGKENNWKKIINSLSWCWPWYTMDPWSQMLKRNKIRQGSERDEDEGDVNAERRFIRNQRLSLIVPVRSINGSGFQFVDRFKLALDNPSQVFEGKYAQDFLDARAQLEYKKIQDKTGQKIFSFLRSLASRRRVEDADLGAIIEAFEKHNMSYPFLLPVTRKEAPDYHQIVKKPMSLSMIKARYNNHEYDGKVGMKNFIKDFELIFSNAFTYNRKSSLVYKLAEEVQEFTVDQIQGVLQSLPVVTSTTGKNVSNYVSQTLMDVSEEEVEEARFSSVSASKQENDDDDLAKMPLPNILVTGTPGTGKSTLCSRLVQSFPSLQHIQISKLAIEQEMHGGRDEDRDCHILDSVAEEKILDCLEPRVTLGGCLIEHHSSNWFPERFFDLVVVLTCENGMLYKRLKARDYEEKKITENVDCEIMQTVLQEALESYKPDKILTFKSETEKDMEQAHAAVSDFIRSWGRQDETKERAAPQNNMELEQRPVRKSGKQVPPSPSLRGMKSKTSEEKQVESPRMSQPKQRRGGEDGDLKENWSALTTAAIEHMLDIWNDIGGNSLAFPFHHPVTKRQALDYKDVIRRPMALSNVMKKLEGAQYKSLVEFFSDMDVIFRNAMLYNKEDSEIAIAARQLQAILHQHCRRILPQTADKLLAEITPKSPAEDLVPAAALHVKATKTPTDPMQLG